jgi:hypothetical protein
VTKGFIQIRRGLEEHLLAGRIGFSEAGAYLVIHLQADFKTGIWTGSAPRLLATAPRGASLRDVQRAIARLETIGFIRVFHQQGKRGNYRVMIHKYEPQSGALKGFRLNALASTSWERPSYESCADDDAVPVTEAAPYLKEEEKQNKEKPSVALIRETIQAAFELFWETWPRKQAKERARSAWLKIPLADYPDVMLGLDKWLRSDQWIRGIIPHPATWLNGKRWQDQDIPIAGGTNGASDRVPHGRKPSRDENIGTSLRGAYGSTAVN